MASLYGGKHSADGREAGPAPRKPKDVGGAYAKFENVDEAYGGPYDGPQQPQHAHPKSKKSKKKGGEANEDDSDDADESPSSYAFTFPKSRVQEFLEIAREAGADADSDVAVDGDDVTVTLPESAARKIRLKFRGDDVTVEEVEETAAVS
jgi:hypothetical protein